MMGVLNYGPELRPQVIAITPLQVIGATLSHPWHKRIARQKHENRQSVLTLACNFNRLAGFHPVPFKRLNRGF